MLLLNQDARLLTGSADSELRAWDINYLQEVSQGQRPVVIKSQQKKKINFNTNCKTQQFLLLTT